MSRRKFIFTQHDKISNQGFDYEGKIFEKTLSNKTISGDENRVTILAKIEKVIYSLIEESKKIRNFYNYTVKKDNKYVR